MFAFLLMPLLGYALVDLKPGDALPDISKIPLVPIQSPYRPQPHAVSSLEGLLLNDGVVILHFTTPRPVNREVFETTMIDEVSALQKAAQSVPYPCNAVAVLPFGPKARADAETLMLSEGEEPWGGARIYYEPTYPRPGLYRTFRPGSDDLGEREISTSWTYIIGPDRKIIAMRGPEESGSLYIWLQMNLPERVIPVPKEPTSNIALPQQDTWVWPAFRRNEERRPEALRLPETLPYTYLAWAANVGRTFASPVVIDNTVYVNTDSNGLRALTLPTGQPILQYSLGASWWSSPAVAGPNIYAASAAGVVHCVERATFNARWRKDLGGLITSSPVVADGRLFIGSRNGAVYALDAATGDILWQFQTGGELSSSPALARGFVLIGSGDRNLYALDARSGELKWFLPTGGPVDSSPTIAGEDVVFGSFDGAVYSARIADGRQNWKCQLEGWVHSSPAVSGGIVYVGTVAVRRGETPSFNWIDLRSGQRRGRFDMPDSIYSSPTVWGDAVLVGCRDYNLYAFDKNMRQTQPLWTFRTRSYLHASPVVVGDTALLAGFDGSLYALRQPKPISAWQPTDVVPRWFLAALAGQLHSETADLIVRAGRDQVGQEHRLSDFDTLFRNVAARVARPGAPPRALPRDVLPDMPGAQFIEYALTTGLLAGQPDGSFQPNEPTNRYQVSFALSSVLESVRRPEYSWRALADRNISGATVEVRVEPLPGRLRTPAADVPSNHWAHGPLARLAELGLLAVDEERRFRGTRIVTLADAKEQWDLIQQALKVVRVQ